MAHKKAAGSSKNGRDSNPKMRGIKVFGGITVPAGSVIVRQKGTPYRLGTGVMLGRDHTIHAAVAGTVQFSEKRIRKYDGRSYRVTLVNVVPSSN